MQETKTLGLAGKARRNHVKRRAYQRYADDLLAEYFDADDEVERVRHIPIKRYSPVVDRTTYGTGSRRFYRVQDESGLDESRRQSHRGDREVVWAPPETTAPSKLIDESLLPLVEAMPKNAPAASDRAIRFKPKPRATGTSSALPFPQEWRPPMAYRSRRRPRSLGGFAYGCLLGSAAAAVLLLIVRVVIG